MSDNTEDVRTKISSEDHAFLSAISLGTGDEIATIVRGLIRDFLAAKRREYTVASRFATAQGIGRESSGKREGSTP